jgi:hypothetical protein
VKMEKIASIIKDYHLYKYSRNKINNYIFINDLCVVFKQLNPRFDKQRFIDACK